MRLTQYLSYHRTRKGGQSPMAAWHRQNLRMKPFNANLQRMGYGKMDGVFPHDGPGQTKRAQTNEFPPIWINRKLYNPEAFRAEEATRRRLDTDIPGPLYLHRWLKPALDERMSKFSRNWRPGDAIEVDPEIYLKTHKYPKDELMLNPYLRFPIYHRLPLHYRLTIEEEVVSYDNIVNSKGTKRPQMEGEWLNWETWTRDVLRGRPGHKEKKHIFFAGVNKWDKRKIISSDEYQEDYHYETVRVNRQHIPYEFPQGKTDKRFYNPLKGGKSENIPGRMDASTEDNYPRNAFEELWGGEGVMRGHTFSSDMKEFPELRFEFNQTWWPERFYNFELKSLLLAQKIRTTVTQSTLDQIMICGGFDEYILATSPAKLMSDFGCRLKREMLYLLNRPEEALKNVDIALKSEHINTPNSNILSPELYLSNLDVYRMPDHSIKWINMPLYDALKLQLAIEFDVEPKNLRDMLWIDAHRKANSDKDLKKVITYGEEEVVSFEELIARQTKGEDFVVGKSWEEKDQLRLSTIEQNLNKTRFGAKYELAQVEEDYGTKAAHLLVNAQHKVLDKYRRKFPDLEHSKHKKWSKYSQPTRNSRYNALLDY